jgi:DNA-binding response OmpR family regulator
MNSSQVGDCLQILVVEDDPTLRRAIARALQRAGHEVVVAGRCGGARALSGAFDVAVLDLELPDGTGVDVAGELLALGRASGVVFFSGAADPSLLGRASRLGTVVAKSGNFDSLLAAVSAVPAHGRRRARQSRARLARL